MIEKGKMAGRYTVDKSRETRQETVRIRSMNMRIQEVRVEILCQVRVEFSKGRRRREMVCEGVAAS